MSFASCIKLYIAKSFPQDHHISSGEMVKLEGYIKGNPVIGLDSNKHKSGYAHLGAVSVMLTVEEFNDHFKLT
jgi:hypothetical protein